MPDPDMAPVDPPVAVPASPPPAPSVAAPVLGLPDDTGWRPLPRAARGVMQIGGAFLGLLLGVPLWLAAVLPNVDGFLWLAATFVLLPLLGAAFGAWMAARRWQATAWRLDDRGLQVRRGRLFQREVFVPRARVQHLDLERGPIERRYGLATIVVHTAGTRLQALRQSGLAEADAVALRDALVPAADVDDDAV
jgi:membrane protein YdbS with pleckstrin-like domain